MSINIKVAIGMIISLLTASLSIGYFLVWTGTTSASLSDSTDFYNKNKVSLNDAVLGKSYPVISAVNQRINLNEHYDPRSWVEVTDVKDGNITAKIEVYDKVDNTTKGDYEIRYVVRNSFGLKTVKKIKVIVD